MCNYEKFSTRLSNLAANDKQKDFLKRLNETIENHMERCETDIPSIASSLNLHPSKLRRDIKALTGITPAHYIAYIRFGRVLNMMTDFPHYSMAKIAETCGFADHAHFTHSFRRMFQTTPLHYKKSLQLKSIE